MSDSITRLLQGAAEERYVGMSTSELWQLGRRAKRRRRTLVAGIGIAASITVVSVAAGYIGSTVPADPDTGVVVAVPRASTPAQRATAATSPPGTALSAGFRPPTRRASTGQQEVMISTVLGETAWVTAPPGFDPKALLATPDLPVIVPGDPQTPRVTLTLASPADIQTVQCPEPPCVLEYTSVATGVGDWRVVADSPSAQLREEVITALSFSPGPGGYLRVDVNSPRVTLLPKYAGVFLTTMDVDEVLSITPGCRGAGPRTGGVEGSDGQYTFCRGGMIFSSGGMRRNVVQEYADNVAVSRE